MTNEFNYGLKNFFAKKGTSKVTKKKNNPLQGDRYNNVPIYLNHSFFFFPPAL